MLSWDANEFRKQASQTESSKDGPTKEQLAALRDYLNQSAEAQRAMRETSMTQEKSIVAVILDATDPKLTAALSAAQHTHCLAWLSAQLSARDRDEITKVMTKSSPDFLTSAVRGAVDTYEPYIRAIHENMDLREHITAVETFIGDFIETSNPKKAKPASGYFFKKSAKPKAEDVRPPSVEDYVALIRRNKGLIYNYLHQFAKNCVDVREKFRGWANVAVAQFQMPNGSTDQGGAGGMDEALLEMYAELPAETREAILERLDAHAVYLNNLDALSDMRMQRVLDQLAKQSTEDAGNAASGSASASGRSSEKTSPKASSPSSPRTSTGEPSMSGPGVYLMRWDSLLDDTLITPATASGPLRRGRDVKGQKGWGKTVSDDAKGEWDAGALAREEDKTVPGAPDVAVVTASLGGRFRDVVNARIGDVVPSLSEKSPAGYAVEDERESAGDKLAMGVEGVALAG